MDLGTFKATLAQSEPPAGLTPPLLALWLEAKGDWHGAHDALQGQPDHTGAAWVHAYLHRKEGDLANADYWYRRAGRPSSKASLAEEWDQIAASLLAGEV